MGLRLNCFKEERSISFARAYATRKYLFFSSSSHSCNFAKNIERLPSSSKVVSMTMTTFLSILTLFCFCVTFCQEREILEEHSRPKIFCFLFSVSLRFSLSLVAHHKKCSSLALSLFSLVLVLLLFWGREEDSPLQHEDDDPVNENDDWVCKNNDYCFHPDIIIVVAKKKFKDHL